MTDDADETPKSAAEPSEDAAQSPRIDEPANSDRAREKSTAARSPAERALQRVNAFELRPEGTYAVTTIVFDASVAVADDPPHYHVTVRAPTLGAAVADDSVADVVETDWYETFALRVRDLPGGVGRSAVDEPEVARIGDEVVVEATLDASTPDRAAADAKALAEFVEGTWVQGVVPGYEYDEPVAGLLSRARQRAEGS